MNQEIEDFQAANKNTKVRAGWPLMKQERKKPNHMNIMNHQFQWHVPPFLYNPEE